MLRSRMREFAPEHSEQYMIVQALKLVRAQRTTYHVEKLKSGISELAGKHVLERVHVPSRCRLDLCSQRDG